MGIEIFARVKDGSLPRVTKTEHNCNIKFTYQKNKYNYNINKIWNNNEGNKEIYDQDVIPISWLDQSKGLFEAKIYDYNAPKYNPYVI